MPGPPREDSPSDPSSADLAADSRAIPGYVIRDELGRGGMGVVYRATQTSLNRSVALKVLVGGAYAGIEEQARFRGEAETAARLQHPNIVQVHEVGECGGRLYLSMEYLSGGSLADRLQLSLPSPREAAQLVATLAGAVHFAHREGVIHRDLKPANVLLTPEGIPKITDFGLAKRVQADAPQTRTGDILGTPSYMAPEQASGVTKQVGPACDVYALGAILYEMLTGRPPHRGPDPVETILLVLSTEPLPPRRLSPGTPRDLETICLKCLQKRPRDRYESAADLADDLGRFLADRPILARRPSPWGRLRMWVRRRPALAAWIGVAAASVLGLGSYGIWKHVQLAAALVQAERQRDHAEANFRLAFDAADRRIDRVGQDPRAMLGEELAFFNGIRRQAGDDPEIEYERAMAARRVGEIYRMLGQKELARAACDEAVERHAGLAEAFPDKPVYRRDLAAAYNTRGRLLGATGQVDAARREFEKAVGLFEALVTESGGDLDYLCQEALTWNNLAVLESREKRLDAAAADHQRALQIRQDLVQRVPDEPIYCRDLIVTQMNLAGLYLKLQRPSEAERLLREALARQRALPPQSHVDREYRRTLASIYTNLGVSLERQGHVEGAATSHEQGIQVFKGLAADYPAAPEFRESLADAHGNLAVLWAAHDQWRRALVPAREAARIYKELADEYRDNPQYRTEAARLQSLVKGLEEAAADKPSPR